MVSLNGMKRFYALLLFALLFDFPLQAFASECSDPSKVVIGFFLLLSSMLVMVFLTAMISYLSVGGRRLLKMWSVLLLSAVLLGMLSLLAGFVKEQNNNSDRIPFLSAKDC